MLCDSKQCVHGSDFFHKILRCSPNSSGTESISPFLMSRVLLEYFILFCSKLLQRFQIILHQPYISQATVSQIFNINAKSHQNTFKYILETFFFWGVGAYEWVDYLIPAHHKEGFWAICHPPYVQDHLSRAFDYREEVSSCWL